MNFDVEEIAIIKGTSPEFKYVNEGMLCADNGTSEETLTKNDNGWYEWVVRDCENPDNPLYPFECNTFREFETMDDLVRFLEGNQEGD